MSTLGAATWGLAGSVCVEALELYSLIRHSRRWSWRKPIPQGLTAYIISVVLRAGAGAALAAAAAGSSQVSGTFAAFALGVAAPLVVEKLTRAVPLSGSLVDKYKIGTSPIEMHMEIGELEHASRADFEISGGDNAP